MADFLDGKKTILAGLLVAILSGLGALGVRLPFSTPSTDLVLSGLGVAVVIFRMFAKTPGRLAPPA